MILLTHSLWADELRVDYSDWDWRSSYSLKIDLSSGEMQYQMNTSDDVKRHTLLNSVETIKYIEYLLSKVKTENLPEGETEGGDQLRFTVTQHGEVTRFSITTDDMWWVYSPAVYLNKNYAAQQDIYRADALHGTFYSHLLSSLIYDLVDVYFVKEWEHVTGRKKAVEPQNEHADGETPAPTLGTYENPVQCDGRTGAFEYLNRLFALDGTPVWFEEGDPLSFDAPTNEPTRYWVNTIHDESEIWMDSGHPGYVETSVVPGYIFIDGIGQLAPAPIPTNEALHAGIFSDVIEDCYFEIPDHELLPQIEKLIASGLNVNARNEDGNTALLMAAHNLHRPAKTFKLLLDAGADVNARNNDGNTAMHMILHWGELDLDAVRLLLDHGISVTTENNDGEPALFSSISPEDIEAAQFLLGHGILDEADADIGNPIFDTAAWWIEQGEKGEETSRFTAAMMLVEAGGDQWENYMRTPFTVVRPAPTYIDPVVSRLMNPSERNDAFRTILSWQKYRSDPPYRERVFNPLRYVVTCPQKEGPPIFAAFPRSFSEQRSVPRGHMMLIDSDGAIIPVSIGNYIEEHSAFQDINADGIMDIIVAEDLTPANKLYVLPVTREQRPLLQILLRTKEHGGDPLWNWRLVETPTPDLFKIELGPIDSRTGEFTPMATYEWSDTEQQYIGPTGGDTQPFKRVFGSMDPCSSVEVKSFTRQQTAEEE